MLAVDLLKYPEYGEVQEWLNWPLSKSGEPQGSEGSNPSLSARRGALRSLVPERFSS